MGARLDQMLEPGERVVYRTDTYRGIVRVLYALMAVIVLFWGLFAALSGLTSERIWWVIAAVLGAMLAGAFGHWLNTGAAIVTDRRLLYDHGPWATVWSRQRLIAVPFVEIAEYRNLEPSWRHAPSLHLTNGRVIGLGNISNPRRLAEALAVAPSDAPSNAPNAQRGEGNGT